jgi:putative transposase
MTRTRYRIFEDQYPYFLTCTVVGWLPVFTRPEAVHIILDSWKFLKQEKDFHLYGYVILENHLHLVASAVRLGSALKSFKMYTARNRIDLLEAHGAKYAAPPTSGAQDGERSSRNKRATGLAPGRRCW